MATDLRSFNSTNIDDAQFRAWGSALSAQLAAVGLTRASDTGQIDWATVLRPATNGVYAGYEMWRFSDSLQASYPVFIKIEYSWVGNLGTIRVTVGTATNGSGTLTGQVSQPRIVNGASGIQPSYCSASSSRLNLCTSLNPASNAFAMIMVERTKDGSGADTTDGILFYGMSTSPGSTPYFQVIPFVGSAMPNLGNNNNNPALDLNSGGFSSFGGNIVLSPTIAYMGKPVYASWLAYRYAELTSELIPLTLTYLGSSHTYMPLGDGATSPNHVLSGFTGWTIAMLWE